MKSIVIGSGGREHTIAWALASSDLISEVICIPGNGGTATESKCRNINANIAEIESLAELCRAELQDAPKGGFVVVGPEDPLASGLADALAALSVKVVGPCQKGAALEASKDVAKHFMAKYGVSCAASTSFTNAHEAISYINERGAPLVIKADGLAAGKGVVVASTVDMAIQAVRDFMIESTLGPAGRKVVIEDYLEGEEVSILAAVSVKDGNPSSRIVPFVTARDHKRLKDGAEGPNTGGMGAIAPADGISAEDMRRFEADILQPTLRGLIAEKFDYRGFIFFGLMLTAKGPKLLEYNVRLGDPETQAVFPLMDFDFARLCLSIIDGTLDTFPVAWKNGYVCAPVAVSRGYPGSYPKGLPIAVNKEALARSGARIFYAGAAQDMRKASPAAAPRAVPPLPGRVQAAPGALITSGGRVLAASAHGETVEAAREAAYAALKSVNFEGMFYRRDIGLPGAAVSGHI